MKYQKIIWYFDNYFNNIFSIQNKRTSQQEIRLPNSPTKNNIL